MVCVSKSCVRVLDFFLFCCCQELKTEFLLVAVLTSCKSRFWICTWNLYSIFSTLKYCFCASKKLAQLERQMSVWASIQLSEFLRLLNWFCCKPERVAVQLFFVASESALSISPFIWQISCKASCVLASWCFVKLTCNLVLIFWYPG